MLKKYIFRQYDENFPKLFLKEREKLTKFLPRHVKIEHFGSTAVPDLGGKGIIDVMITVRKSEILLVKKVLQKKKYLFILSAGDKERLFFQKDYGQGNKTRRVHIHLTFQDSLVWKKAIAVRNYLKKYRKEAQAYERIKKLAAKECEDNGEVYCLYKKDVLKKLVKKALRDFEH